MAIVITENTSTRRMSLKSPWTAVREFVVTGTENEYLALTATGIPQQNDLHPFSSSLKCEGPGVSSRPSAGFFVIACPYSIPPMGQFPSTDPDNPLLAPPTISFETVEVSELVDIDLLNTPMRYSNGEAVEPLPRTITYKRFRYERNEPYYDQAKVDAYENTCNDAPITIGSVTYAAQHIRCASICPDGTYQIDPAPPYIKMAYIFETITDGRLGPLPFQHRVMDQGSYGWYLDGSTKRTDKFTGGDGNTVGNKIRLDGTGLPLAIEGPIKVGKGQTPVTPVTATSFYDSDGSASAIWLYFIKTKIVSFTGLI